MARNGRGGFLRAGIADVGDYGLTMSCLRESQYSGDVRVHGGGTGRASAVHLGMYCCPSGSPCNESLTDKGCEQRDSVSQ